MLKNKVFFCLCLMLVFFVPSSFAETSVTFDEVCKYISAKTVTYGNFKQVKSLMLRGKSTSLNSEGKFIICNKGIVWDTKKPISSVMVVSETKMVQTLASGKTSVMEASSNAVYSGISATLSSLFKGDATKLKENFDVSFSVEKESWKMFLIPKDENLALAIKSVSLEGKAIEPFDLEKVLLTESSDQTILYVFSDQKYTGALTDEQEKYFK